MPRMIIIPISTNRILIHLDSFLMLLLNPKITPKMIKMTKIVKPIVFGDCGVGWITYAETSGNIIANI